MPQPRWREALGLLFWLALSLLMVGLNGLATATSVGGWYRDLVKPSFQPPNWVFGPAWTVLFILMAIAAWRVWRRPATPARSSAIALYLAQMVPNLAWSVIFFGLRLPRVALVDILILWCMILATVVMFRRQDRPAGWLLVPYLAWVGFASVLNLGIVVLN